MAFMVLTEKMIKLANDALDKAAELLKDHPEEKQRILLEACFGECVFAENFSFDEAIDWIENHDDLLSNGNKAMILKIDDKKFMSWFGKKSKVALKGDKYLVITIMGDNIDKNLPKEKNNLLVKYETLDAELESVLAKGSFVVEG